MAFQKGHVGYWTGKKRAPFSEEWRGKMSESSLGKKKSQAMKDKLRIANLGKTHTEATRKKMSDNQTGLTGEKARAWKGDEAGKPALHEWIRTIKGSPKECELCGTKDSKRYDWSNKTHEYKRDVDDWQRLCYKCHYKYDKALRRERKAI